MISYKNKRLYIGRTMHACRAELWNIVTSTDRWCDWGVGVYDVDCESNRIAAGTSGRVSTLLSITIPFEVLEYQDKSYWLWRLGRFKATGHSLVCNSPTSSTLYFDLPWWAAPCLPACWLALWRISRMCGVKKKEIPSGVPEPSN